MIPVNKSDIWKLSSEEFNQWRRDNDLPKLMNFFHESLPFFSEWQQKFNLTDDIIMSHDHTGDFFIWQWEKKYIQHSDKDSNCEPLVIVDNKFLDRIESLQLREYSKSILAIFVPYFDWLHKDKNQFYFVSKNDPNEQPKETLTYQSWSGTWYWNDIQPKLFHEFDVLVLWWEIVDWKLFKERNLDFLWLDNLTIINDISANSRYSKIQFSSVNNLIFRDIGKNKVFWPSSWAFLEFYNCHLENTSIYNSHIQNMHFIDCGNFNFYEIRNSDFFHLVFNNTIPSIWRFENTDFRETEIINERPIYYSNISKLYEKLALSFSKSWDYSNAWEMYYLKQKYNMLSLLYPSKWFWIKEYSRMLYDGTQDFKSYIKVLIWNVKTLSLTEGIKNIIKVLFMLISFVLWGFWERPYNTIVASWIIVILFSFTYEFNFNLVSILYNLHLALQAFLWIKNDPNIYESIMTALGLILFGFLIAGLTNKKSY